MPAPADTTEKPGPHPGVFASLVGASVVTAGSLAMGIYSTLHANADAASARELRAELPAPGGPGQVCTSHWGQCEQVEIALESADFNTKIAALAFGCSALGALGTGIVAGVLASSGGPPAAAGAEGAPSVALVPIVNVTGGPAAGLAVGGRF